MIDLRLFGVMFLLCVCPAVGMAQSTATMNDPVPEEQPLFPGQDTETLNEKTIAYFGIHRLFLNPGAYLFYQSGLVDGDVLYSVSRGGQIGMWVGGTAGTVVAVYAITSDPCYGDYCLLEQALVLTTGIVVGATAGLVIGATAGAIKGKSEQHKEARKFDSFQVAPVLQPVGQKRMLGLRFQGRF